MEKSEQPVDGAITVESLMLEGFKVIEAEKPLKLQQLIEPLIGIYKEKSKGAQSSLYHIETVNGLRHIRGCTDLDAHMKKVSFGQHVAIFFNGSKTLESGKTMYTCIVVAK